MHTQEETLKILGCDKATLSRYVKKDELTRHKKGRRTYYDEHEVALLAPKIDENKRKVGIEVTPKEKIELPPDIENEVQELAADTMLNKIGIEVLFSATQQLNDMGIYEDCDKQILLWYALSVQAYNHYYSKSMEISISMTGEKIKSEDGTIEVHVGKSSVHAYHKIMMDHQKQMLAYSDRLGLNPLSRQKFEIKEPKKSTILDVMSED